MDIIASVVGLISGGCTLVSGYHIAQSLIRESSENMQYRILEENKVHSVDEAV